jgi:hypothetical protein
MIRSCRGSIHVLECGPPESDLHDVVQNSLLSQASLDHAEVVHILECELP